MGLLPELRPTVGHAPRSDARAALGSGLVAHLLAALSASRRLGDQVTGRIADVQGSPQWETDRQLGPAVRCQGSPDYLSLAEHPNWDLTGSFTFFARLRTSASTGILLSKRPNTTTSNYVVALQTSGSNNYLNLQWRNPGSTEYSLWGSDGFPAAPHSLAVVHQYSSAAIRYYIDGQADSGNPHTRPADFLTNNGNLLLGAQDEGALNSYLNAAFAELRIYNRALCAEEIARLSDPRQQQSGRWTGVRQRARIAIGGSATSARSVFGSRVVRGRVGR